MGDLASVVYFVRRQDGAVKVGFTTQIRNRLYMLRIEYGALQVEAMCPGGREAEGAFHRALADERITGEWFCGPKVEALIAETLATHGSPDLSRCAAVMRVNVTLGEDEIADLTTIMAAMPTQDGRGRPVGITPADALRYALKKYAAG